MNRHGIFTFLTLHLMHSSQEKKYSVWRRWWLKFSTYSPRHAAFWQHSTVPSVGNGITRVSGQAQWEELCLNASLGLKDVSRCHWQFSAFLPGFSPPISIHSGLVSASEIPSGPTSLFLSLCHLPGS